MSVLGAQRPRVFAAPKFTKTYGPDSVGLMNDVGAPVDDWQAFSLGVILALRGSGTWACSIVGISCPRQNGKNYILEGRELFGSAVLGEKILHTAHHVKTSNAHFQRMKDLLESHPDLKAAVRKVSNTNGQEAIFFKNGGSIRFIARSKSSGRGFSADVLVLDEAQEMSDEELSALAPILAASPNPQTIYTGTPPGPLVNGAVFARIRAMGLDGTDERLAWLEWSAEKGSDLDDHEAWAVANPALGLRLSIEKTQTERSMMDDAEFGRERMGMWTGLNTNTVIDMDLWLALAKQIDPVDPVAFAVDVSPDRDKASIVMAGYVNEAIVVQVVVCRTGTDWITAALKKLQEQWNPCGIFVDDGSPASTLGQEFKRAGIKVTYTNTSDMSNACGLFYDRIQQEKLFHAGQQDLTNAVAGATKRPLRDAWAWNRRNATVDITPLVAATLAAYGLTTKRQPKGSSERKRRIVMK